MQEKAIYLESDALQIEMGNIVSKTGTGGTIIYDTARTNQHKVTAAKDTKLRVDEKTELWGQPAVVLNVTGVGSDDVYYVENEWEIDENAEWNEANYTLPTGKYVRMKRLLPGEQVIMTVDSTLYAALAVGDAVQPAAGGTIAKVTTTTGGSD